MPNPGSSPSTKTWSQRKCESRRKKYAQLAQQLYQLTMVNPMSAAAMANQGGCAMEPPRNRYNNIRGERNLDPLRLETIFTVGSPPSNLIGSLPTHGSDKVGTIIDSSASTDAPIKSPPHSWFRWGRGHHQFFCVQQGDAHVHLHA